MGFIVTGLILVFGPAISAVLVLGGMALFFLGLTIAKETLKRKLKRQNEIEQLIREKINPTIQIITDSTSEVVTGGLAELHPLAKSIELLRTLPSGSVPSINIEYQKELEKLQERITAIESKFPSDETNIDKIASINDAIFLTKIDGLSKAVENIERKMLSKWDVAKIVVMIIGLVMTAIGVVFAVVTYFSAR